MQAAAYQWVVFDAQGRRLTAWQLLSQIWLRTAFFSLSAALLLASGVVWWGMQWHAEALQSRQLRQANAQLQGILTQCEQQVPQLREAQRLVSRTFQQIVQQAGSKNNVLPAPTSMGASQEPRAALAQLQVLHSQLQYTQEQLSDTLEHFADAALLLANTPSIRPVQAAWFSSAFGRRRDPFAPRWLMHKGLDLGGRLGMEVRAPADGVVIWVDWRGGYGNTVVLDHGFGLQTHFAHLSQYDVRLGEQVRRYDVIARLGSSGRSTGPHLHYEVRRHGQPLDPRRFILDD